MERKIQVSLSIIMLIVICTAINIYSCSGSDQPVVLPGTLPDDFSTLDTPNTNDNVDIIQQSAKNQELAIITRSLPEGTKWLKYNTSLSAQGGLAPYTWIIKGLPAGISAAMYTGVISGTPVQTSISALDITVVDSNGKSVSGTLKLVVRDINNPKTQLTKNGVKVKIGDYVQFGRYLGKSILWRVINLDDLGQPLLFSESILTFKAYDASESGASDKNSEDSTYAEDCGSSRWVNSNLKEWLNSSDKRVKYTTQPPTKAAVLSGNNYYSEEAGFLYGFTLNEQKTIGPITHSAVLSSYDKEVAEGGIEPLIHYYNCEIPSKAIENEDSAYYEMATDRVFLLSIAEVAGLLEARGWDWKRGITAEAKIQAKEYDCYENHGNYWLRTALDTPLRGGIVCAIDSFGDVNRYSAYAGSCGVCPALYLNLQAVSIESGLGSKTKPYVIK